MPNLTLVDQFELRNVTTEYVYRAPDREYVARQSIDVEVEWEEEAQAHDWSRTTTESSPGVSIESWSRSRGWCAE